MARARWTLNVVQSMGAIPSSTNGRVGVRTFTSALEFLDGRERETPACLVLDVNMPDLNGLELQEYLADKEISLPIVFITGYGTVPESVKAMKAGAVDFLQKPFSEEDFLDAISRAIETDRGQDRIRSS